MTISTTRVRALHLLCGTAIGLLAATPALAAPTEPAIVAAPAAPVAADGDEERKDDIVVSGRRQAIADAQNNQIHSQSFATIVSGEELRAQPQQNLADLLTRLPGLSSSVDQSRNAAGTGEAQYLSIRGLDTSYNAYMFDGVRLAQTDARTRAISMNLLSPFALSEVRVDKAPTAALDGDAIAGVIDLRTASAFDLPNHHTQIRAQGQVAGRAAARSQDPWGGTVQVETAQRFGNFGVYASAYYGKKNILGESTAMQHDWEKYNNAIPGMIRDNLDNIAPRGVQWNVFRNKIERVGGTLNIDWKGDDLDLYSRTTYGRYKLKSWMDQTALRQTDLAPGQINPNPGGRGSYDAAGFRADYGLTATHYFRTEHSNQELFSTKLGGQSRVGDFTFDYHAAYSRGSQDYPLRIQSGFAGRPYIGAADPGTATYRMVTSIGDRITPQVLLDAGARAALLDLSKLKQWYVTQQFENAWESRLEGQFDGKWKLADQGLVALSAGMKVEASKRYSNSLGDDGALQYTFPLNGQPAPRYNAQGPSVADTPGELLGGFMHNGAQVPIKLLDSNYIEDQVRRLSTPLLANIDPTKLQENRLDGNEYRTGAYVQADLVFGDLTVIPGVRYERNRFKGRYLQQDDAGNRFVTTTRSYGQWLPSIVAALRPNERTVFRASVRKSYSRPAFDLLLGPTQIGRDDSGRVNSIYTPNPNLKATESWNFDTSAEYKGDGTDLFSVGLYYKRLNHVLFATGTTNAGGDYNIWSPDKPTSVDGVEVSTLDTNAKGKVYGIEAAGRYSFKGLPGLFDGLGLGGNVTVQRAEATVLVNGQQRNQRMTQAPRLMYNAELFYNRGGLNAAVNYNYTGDRLYDLRSSRPDTYIQPVAKMNAMVSYAFRNGLSAGVSVENVLDAHNYWATTSERQAYLSNDRKGGYVETGRVYMLNLSYVF